jgi:hypothetical protein
MSHITIFIATLLLVLSIGIFFTNRCTATETQEQSTTLKQTTIIQQDIIDLFWWLRYGQGQGPGSWPWSKTEGPVVVECVDEEYEEEYPPGGDVFYGPPWPPLWTP